MGEVREVGTPQSGQGPSTPEENNHKVIVIVLVFDGITPLNPNNPIKMAPLMNKKFGDVSRTRNLRSGDLFMKCKSVDQWDKVMKIQYFDGVRVLWHIPRSLRKSRGVIYRIDPSIEIDDITSHLEEVGVVDAAVSPRSGMGSECIPPRWFCILTLQSFPRTCSWTIKPSLYGNTFHLPEDATNAKSLVKLLQPVEANNAAANVMESRTTEASLVKKCFVPIVVVTTVQHSEDVLKSGDLPGSNR